MHVLICYIWFDNKVRFCVSWNHFIMKSYSLEYHLTTKKSDTWNIILINAIEKSQLL
jgi:hypothetical protein